MQASWGRANMGLGARRLPDKAIGCGPVCHLGVIWGLGKPPADRPPPPPHQKFFLGLHPQNISRMGFRQIFGGCTPPKYLTDGVPSNIWGVYSPQIFHGWGSVKYLGGLQPPNISRIQEEVKRIEEAQNERLSLVWWRLTHPPPPLGLELSTGPRITAGKAAWSCPPRAQHMPPWSCAAPVRSERRMARNPVQ